MVNHVEGASGRVKADRRKSPLTLDEPLLQRLFEDAVKRSGTFGAQLSIIKADQQVNLAAGFANAPRAVAMTTGTLMQIGSNTKLFNAMIALSLVDDGALDLDTPVKGYLPRFKVKDPQACQSLTLRHLLSMSSGLDNGPYVYSGSGEDALSRYVEQLESLPQHFPPGKYFGYSNAGTCIAGHIASRVTGKPWERLLRERILEPAGLNHSAILDEDVQDKVISVGHDLVPPDGGKLRIVEPIFTSFRARAPSGPSLALNAGDLARFGQIFIKKGIADTGARILSASAVDLMMSPQIAMPSRKYGAAWCIGAIMGNWNGTQVWGHAGTAATSTAFLYWIPEQAGVIAFAVNTHTAMGEFSEIAFEEILNAAFEFSKPRIDLPEVPLASVDPQRYVGMYEELGMRVEVTRGEGESLRARFVPKVIAQELGVRRTAQSMILTPLGGDRFLVNPTDGPDKRRGVVDMAFFGDDGQGRATNVLNLVFPMSRIEIG